MNVTVLNGRPGQFAATVELTDESDDVIFESELDIPAPDDEAGRKLITLEDVARVSDGEDVDAVVRIDDREYEASQAITCDDGKPTNLFRFVIYTGEDVHGDGMRLQALSTGGNRTGSSC